ncbi:MAG: TolC family protein [Muribaculaceae bacterium]|nr:TolC family protein [Muribaculaceae bacterium]
MIQQRLLMTALAAAMSAAAGMNAAAQAETPAAVITLEEIFASAEANSSQLRPSFAAEREAQLAVDVAKASRLPDINANIAFSFIGDGFTTARDFSDYQKAPIPHYGNSAGIDIEQPIYTGGAITAGIRMAELKSSASRFATDLQRDNIRFRLAGYYLDIYKFSNLRTVMEQNIARAEKVLEEMRARYEQGTALSNDITRYELLLSNYNLQLVKIDNMISILSSDLLITAGMDPTLKFTPDASILDKALPSRNGEWWESEALGNSPRMQLASSGVEISKQAERLAKSDLLPKIGVQAKWVLDGPVLVEVPPINRNLSYWYVGLGVSYDVSSLYKGRRNLDRSRAATAVAVDQAAATSDELTMQIRAEYIKYLEAYEELKTCEKSVELANRNYEVTATRYSADMALITDMLDAANARLDADQQLVNARINIIYNYYKLLFTSGTI